MCFDQIRQHFPNKIGFYKDCIFNIKINEHPPVEVLLIESEISMRCIRKDAIEGIDITSCTIHVQQSMQIMAGWKDNMVVFL
jgi:hypothetical protein